MGALGAGRCGFNLITVLPRSIPDRSPRPGDERFETLTGRRPVLESAFAQIAEDTAGVKIARGMGVDGPVTGPSVRPGVPHVTGVRTSDGAEIAADLVIDAMGRRSKLDEWVTALGGRSPFEEAADTGFAYYTRHYRSRSGYVPEFRGPVSATLGTILTLTVLADNDTWTVAIAAMAGDRPLKELRHDDVWERAARAIPHVAHWIDGEPLCDVRAMAGVLDRRRRIVVDDQPVVTGLIPVGDAWACTNPTAGRGMSLGLAHAIALRDVLREYPADPARLAEAFDRVTEETLTPWYREQIDRDHQRAAEVRAAIEGRSPARPANGAAPPAQAAFPAAAKPAGHRREGTIRRELLTRDRNDPSRYLNVVFFDSYESAMENSNLPETQAGVEQFRDLMDGPPIFHDLDVIDDRT